MFDRIYCNKIAVSCSVSESMRYQVITEKDLLFATIAFEYLLCKGKMKMYIVQIYYITPVYFKNEYKNQ